MNNSRRRFFQSAVGGAAFLGAGVGRLAAQPSDIAIPDPATFRGGDLLWPKIPGAFVPYNSLQTADYEAQREQWYREKRAFIARLRTARNPAQEDLDLANRLERMSSCGYIRATTTKNTS